MLQTVWQVASVALKNVHNDFDRLYRIVSRDWHSEEKVINIKEIGNMSSVILGFNVKCI